MAQEAQKQLQRMAAAYAGRTVADFMDSDVAELIGIDTWWIDGQEWTAFGEDYYDDCRIIASIRIRTAAGYTIAHIQTTEASA
jgi:hypothetical protein